MKKRLNIALIYDDNYYIENFRDYLLGKRKEEYIIYFFSSLETFYENSEDTDMIIIGENLLSCDFINRYGLNKIMVMTDEENVDSISGVKSVYRYQQVEELINQIIEECINRSILVNKKLRYIRKNETRIISIFTPIDSLRTEIWPVKMGVCLAKKGYRILYIDLKEFSVLDNYIMGNTSGNFSDIIYLSMTQNEALSLKIESIIGYYNGLEYIPAVKCGSDLRNIDTEYIIRLIKKIGEMRNYNVIIISLSSIVQDYLRIIAESFESIIPYENDKYWKIKKDKLINYISNQSEYEIDNIREYLIENSDMEEGENLSFITDELDSKIRGD
ncbi:MAG: hypothetical protein IIT48_06720 [Lachnospiraceae bacterium]|nr:hypothetical protein [Lachnospiraceae bacterium]